MKYLFFDIECANCFDGTGKICEFGYVVVNEQFEEQERDIFIINPRAGFDWYVVKKMLYYKVNVYKAAEDYRYYFNKIKGLFSDKEMMIFGHTTDADIKYLNDEAQRYKRSFFNCKFYDVKYMYNTFTGMSNKSVGVAKICDELGISKPEHEHRSIDDADATMRIVKEICVRMGITVNALIERCEDCQGETCNGIVKTVVGEKARIRREELEKLYGANIKNNLLRGDNKVKFLQFLDAVKPQSEISQCELTGKRICISSNYEYAHFREMLSLVQLLKNRGCTYITKASESDYFVTYDIVDSSGSKMKCSRLNYVGEAIANGVEIKIITLKDLLEILGVSEQDLLKMSFPKQ